MMLYTKNTKVPTKKLLQLISRFSKVTGYKANTQKYVAFLHTNSELSESKKKKKQKNKQKKKNIKNHIKKQIYIYIYRNKLNPGGKRPTL